MWTGRSSAMPGAWQERRWSAGAARQVGMPGAHDHGALAVQIAHGDAALGDARARAGARVLGQPVGAADGRHAVVAVGAELAVAVAAPEPAPGALQGRGAGQARRLGAAAADAALQVDVDDPVVLRGLADDEAPAAELGGLDGAALVQRGGHGHGAVGGVDQRGGRDVRARAQGDGLSLGGANADGAGARADGERLAEDRRVVRLDRRYVLGVLPAALVVVGALVVVDPVVGVVAVL